MPNEPASFDEVLSGDDHDVPAPNFEGASARAVERRRRRGLAALSVSLGAVVAAVVIVGVLVGIGGGGFFGVIGSAGISKPSVAPTSTTSPQDVAQLSRETVELDGVNPTTTLDASGVEALADRTWVAEIAARTDIPPRALAAYAGAAIRLATEQPGCGLGWNTLAAIGMVETQHGAIDGGHITRDGRISPDVFGPQLDGKEFQAIRDTDGGSIDGDAVWDRAVGPMQFIPTTWLRWKADGNADGRFDPQNLDDAALAAARYLCADGRDLRNSAAWIAAVNSYNPTVDYNNRVAEAATRYAAA